MPTVASRPTVLMCLTCQKILSNSRYGIRSLILHSVGADFELLFSLLYDILCVLFFLLCMFVLYVTVLLRVGVMQDDHDHDDDDDHDTTA